MEYVVAKAAKAKTVSGHVSGLKGEYDQDIYIHKYTSWP